VTSYICVELTLELNWKNSIKIPQHKIIRSAHCNCCLHQFYVWSCGIFDYKHMETIFVDIRDIFEWHVFW